MNIECQHLLGLHGEAVHALSGDSVLGEELVMNCHAALPVSECAVRELAVKLTDRPEAVGEADREALRRVNFSEPAVSSLLLLRMRA